MPVEFSDASVHRLLAAGSQEKDFRVSEKTIKPAAKALASLLDKIAASAQEQMQIKQSKTVTEEMVQRYVEKSLACAHLDKDMLGVKRGKGEKRGLAQAQVLAEFLKHGDVRVTEGAKLLLLTVSEAYLKALGHRAAQGAKLAGRRTMKERDVRLAIAQL